MKRLIPSLPENARLSDVFRRFPATLPPLIAYHDALLRGDSPLSVGERELIAAYVSALNACRLCANAHQLFARAHGIDPTLIDALMDNPETANVDNRLQPILAYVRKLTLEPAKMTEADAQAVYDADWSEQALFDAIQTCALFNFMNRIVEGTGAVPGVDPAAVRAEDLAEYRMDSYVESIRALGVLD